MDIKNLEIDQLLKKLSQGYTWIVAHQDDEDLTQIEGLIARSEPIVGRLEELGIDRQFSIELLMFGIPIKDRPNSVRCQK